jgi:hypothetical protein
MKLKEEMFLSKLPMEGYVKATDKEAEAYLKERGFNFIHVDTEGNLHALSKENRYLDGCKVYKKKVIVFDK